MYCKLTVIAQNESTKVWLADPYGHLVDCEVGKLETSVLAGRYVIHFGLGGPTIDIQLAHDTVIKEDNDATGNVRNQH